MNQVKEITYIYKTHLGHKLCNNKVFIKTLCLFKGLSNKMLCFSNVVSNILEPHHYTNEQSTVFVNTIKYVIKVKGLRLNKSIDLKHTIYTMSPYCKPR